MKIIALLPVKNETWILRFSLKNLSQCCDEIILLDDTSSDSLLEVTCEYPKVTVIPFYANEKHVNMSHRRNVLLAEGRKRHGTHFVCLDADEIFSSLFIENISKVVTHMIPGEKIFLPWILLNRKHGEFTYSKAYEENLKDFIFCDDTTGVFPDQALSEQRTPGPYTTARKIAFKDGAVFHFQNIPEKRNQFKQAWYRCNEFLEHTKSARRINLLYGFTKTLSYNSNTVVEDAFIEANKYLIHYDADYIFYLTKIKEMFKQQGVIFFEPLDIWYLEDLYTIFINEVGRPPKPEVFPSLVIAINTIKNKIKNAILLKYSLAKQKPQ